MQTQFSGWIGATRIDQEHLASLGIELGRYDERRHTFEGCRLGEAALRALARFDGAYSWGVVETSRLGRMG